MFSRLKSVVSQVKSTVQSYVVPTSFSIGSDTPDALTRAEQEVLQIIKNHRALVKVIGDESNDFDFIIDQIVNPTTNRPSQSVYYYTEHENLTLPDEVKKTNLLTSKTHMHKPGKCRYTKHKDVVFEHTLKTPATLIPVEPQYMRTFEAGISIGFLWDIDSCKIKPKYIFRSDADTSNVPWYDIQSDLPDNTSWIKSLLGSLEAVRNNNNAAIANKTIIYWNEILAGLPKGKIDAVFSRSDTLEMRLAAWKIMLYAKNKLGLADNLPVLVMQAGSPHRIYTAAEHEKDLQIAAVHTPNKPVAGIVNKREREAHSTESKKSGFWQNHPRFKKVLTGTAIGLGVLAIAAVSVAVILTGGTIGIAIAAGLMAVVAAGVGVALTIDALKTENSKRAGNNTSQNQNAVEMTSVNKCTTIRRSSTAYIHNMGIKINSPAPAVNQETFDTTAVAISMPTIENTNSPLSANATLASEGFHYKP